MKTGNDKINVAYNLREHYIPVWIQAYWGSGTKIKTTARKFRDYRALGFDLTTRKPNVNEVRG